MKEKKSVLVIGAGGHSKVLIDAISLLGYQIHGATSNDPASENELINGVKILGNDEIIEPLGTGYLLVNGVGMTPDKMTRRSEIYSTWKRKGYSFLTVIHPFSHISRDAVVEEGAQIMAGVILQPGVIIGANTIINTASSIDHDCIIKSHSHVAPGCTLSGGVKVGEGTILCTGAKVVQSITIGDRTIVAAGAVVTSDIPGNVRVQGIPAKVV